MAGVRPMSVRQRGTDRPGVLVLGVRDDGALLLAGEGGALSWCAAEELELVDVYFDHDETWERHFRGPAGH